MNNFGKLTGNDINQLSYVVSDAVIHAMRNRESLERIADRFHHGDFADAFKECLLRGIDEMMMMCDMDDKMEEESKQAEDPAGLLQAFNKGLGGQ